MSRGCCVKLLLGGSRCQIKAILSFDLLHLRLVWCYFGIKPMPNIVEKAGVGMLSVEISIAVSV